MMGSVLDLQTESVLEHARARDLVKLSRSVGQVTGVCASCHAQYRDQPIQ
jgi:cytochrome c556